MGLFLESLYCSIVLCILFFCQYHTVLITIACNIIWDQEVWCLQLCSSFSRLIWLLVVPWGSIWILKFFFYFCKKCHWDFDRDGTESVNCFAQDRHFNIIKFSYLWRQEDFPFWISWYKQWSYRYHIMKTTSSCTLTIHIVIYMYIVPQ